MAEDLPFGFRGSSTELLEQLHEFRANGADDLTLWPADGRSLSVVLRRLLVHLARKGVEVSIGHRAQRGKRIVTIRATGSGTVAGTPSAATRRNREKAAPSKGTRLAPSRADARDTGFTGVLTIDADLLASIQRDLGGDGSRGSDHPGRPRRDDEGEA
jgi:hypothetical protein